jgi:hypothetical protein
MNRAIVWVSVLVLAASAATAGQVGYEEEFALATNRDEVLKRLIPGTEEYYYYACLHLQHTGQLDQVDELLKSWAARHQTPPPPWNEIRNRQALLRYPAQPKESLQFLKDTLRLTFNHQQEPLDKKSNLLTRLDETLISRETLTQRAMAQSPELSGFEDSALDWLIRSDLNELRRNNLLRRLMRPDYSNLVDLVAADLGTKYTGGFGQLPIHSQMLLEQLEALLQRVPQKEQPKLLNDSNFVAAYLAKLQPADGIDWRYDVKEHRAYLERLTAFAARLGPVHNSLKASILHRQLVLDRSQGEYVQARFMEYIKLPRRAVYVRPQFLDTFDKRSEEIVRLDAEYERCPVLPAIGNDEPLVRSYLMHFLADAESYDEFAEYIESEYLKRVFAETKLILGKGDPEKWIALLGASEYKALQERVDIDFAWTNRETFGPEEAVALDLHVKNVKTLIVKVYEINARNFYQTYGREVGTDINLDGLVANEEKVETYTDAPVLRVKRSFAFDKLKPRGVYVVEFIGNGKSSRALIRKGKLNYTVRTGVAGQVFTVYDESNRQAKDATLWIDGHLYTADEDGTLCVPFSTNPGERKAILGRGEFASLVTFNHQGENYSLAAGIHVDREALLARQKATVIVRPALYLNQTPVTLKALEEVSLAITSTDLDGVNSTKVVSDFKVFEDREALYEFRVPERLRTLRFELRAKVKLATTSKKIDLAAGDSFDLNGIDSQDSVENLVLGRVEGQYVLDVLGKTGEPRAGRAVALQLKHRDFTQVVDVSLQSDAAGRIVLGALKDIVTVRVTGPEGRSQMWTLTRDVHTCADVAQGRAGDTIRIPCTGSEVKAERAAVSLLETRAGTFLADRFAAVSVAGGMLEIKDLPTGVYSLLLKESGRTITVRLAEGERQGEYILGKSQYLQVVNAAPLVIADLKADADAVRIQLANSSKFARVHVVATRYLPEYDVFGDLGLGARGMGRMGLATVISEYASGRSIGDEYQYIIDRKYAAKFPGNMLTRPGLLLNPWAVRKTETGLQQAAGGEGYGRGGAGGQGQAFAAMKRGREARQQDLAGFAGLDFLPSPAVVLTNLEPDKDGVIVIDRKLLGDRQQVHVLAVDPENTAYREISLAEQKLQPKDLTLVAAALDPKVDFSEQKQVTVVEAGQSFRVDDITSGKWEVIDTLSGAYRLYATLSGDATLKEFQFILDWPKMKPEEKREKYSKYACHELSFFLYHKDPEFFKSVVLPYLKNKKDKTFLDRWLIGDDVTEFTQPWKFEQLNTVERILLARQVKDRQATMARHVKDQFDLIPPNVEEFTRRFLTALQGSSLEADGKAAKFDAAKDQAEKQKLAQAMRTEGRAMAANGMSGRLAAGAVPADAPAESLAVPSAPAPATAAPAAERELANAKEMKKAEAAAKPQATRDGQLQRKDVDKAVDELTYDYDDRARANRMRQLYRQVDRTEELAENNYYHLVIGQQNAALITVNAFWNDYAAAASDAGFRSKNLADASRNFAEMMLALAVLDLPYEAKEHKTTFDGPRLDMVMASPAIVFHKQIRPAQPAEQKSVLVSQDFFRPDDRYTYEGNEKIEKYVTDEFLAESIYGCHVVITNPTSARKKLDVLVQIPRGAIAVSGGQATRSIHLDLEPYRTETLDYYFYFPRTGQFVQYPVHVAQAEKMAASVAAVTLNVVAKLTKIDTASWDYISQQGTEDDVIKYLQANNLNRTKLDRIAWRMRDKAFFEKVLGLLNDRLAYDQTLWSYGIFHDVPAATRQFLTHESGFVSRCGAYLDTPLLTIDPVERKAYEHLEYSPLVNARAHRLGKKTEIVNDRFYAQYERLLTILRYRPQLDDADRLAVTYYLLLQDRVEEGLAMLKTVDARKLPTQIQYDYLQAYAAFYREDLAAASKIAEQYKNYPVDRWQKLFANVLVQVDEAQGKGGKVTDEEDRTQAQAQLAATESNFDLKAEARKVTIDYQNLSECVVNYYLMDIELMFSRQPFVQDVGGQFSFIRPNLTETIKLKADQKSHAFDLPKQFQSSNVLIEVTAGGQTKSQACYSRTMTVQVIENYGQIKVTQESSGKPLSKVYVKVYARTADGQVKFYKDGYTDVRGRFEYTSVSTNELDNVERFAMLVLSDTDGAMVREAAPPQR